MARRIKFDELLKSRNITAYQLAKELGCDHSRIYKWISGKSAPSAAMMLRLTVSLNVSAEEILRIFAEE